VLKRAASSQQFAMQMTGDQHSWYFHMDNDAVLFALPVRWVCQRLAMGAHCCMPMHLCSCDHAAVGAALWLHITLPAEPSRRTNSREFLYEPVHTAAQVVTYMFAASSAEHACILAATGAFVQPFRSAVGGQVSRRMSML
jgi:hypothetical protein